MVLDELRNNIESMGNIEEDGVEVLLVEIVVSKEDIRVGVDVGLGVCKLLVYYGLELVKSDLFLVLLVLRRMLGMIL